jgi:outer membrane receptor for ferrienterochelin and colicins
MNRYTFSRYSSFHINTWKARIPLVLLFWLLNSISTISLSAQLMPELRGNLSEQLEEAGHVRPISDARIFWLDGHAGTFSDENGNFTLLVSTALPAHLVIQAVGYQTDTLLITDPKLMIERRYTGKFTLNPIEVSAKQESNRLNSLDPIKVETLGQGEFQKAACCNLSESFTTNPTVDVSYPDPVTGIRDIQILGLAGTTTQLLTENQPLMRAYGRVYGMNYIPGTWLKEVMLNKGTGSVINGYESMAGQINIELLKPEDIEERVFLNLYANNLGRLEGNLHTKWEIGKWQSALLLHSNRLQGIQDHNRDGFMDMPNMRQFNVLNRWHWKNKNGWGTQIVVQAINDQLLSGQVNYNRSQSHENPPYFGAETETQRIQVNTKTGYTFKGHANKSIGLQTAWVYHEQKSDYCFRPYDNLQKQIHFNLIYQSPISFLHDHSFKAGISYLHDDLREHTRLVFSPQAPMVHFSRFEQVPGVFYEHTYRSCSVWTVVAGARADYHSMFGWLMTPRLNARWMATDGFTMRFAGGRGYHVSNPLADQLSVMGSSRQFMLNPAMLNYLESAWNIGMNATQCFKLGDIEGTATIDVYRTYFTNQVLLEWDQNPRLGTYYSAAGSYSNAIQAEFRINFNEDLGFRTAYKWLDVQQPNAQGQMTERPFYTRHLVMLNGFYEINRWKFDATLTWRGAQRLPNTLMNPAEFRMPNESPTFATLNAQVSYAFKVIDIYVGGENLTNVRQTHVIISPANPFSGYFDSNFAWGPVVGTIGYVGIRLRL